ncbi:MAG: single-stranded DNA-binding protein, partial [Chloroflexi bacterium]|nr:single-stranded DNA-binding protein [Chloroflexota bacterium]
VWGKQAEAAAQHLGKGDLVCVHSERFQVSTWTAQDNSPQGQLEVTARRVEFIITKRGPAADPDADEDVPF